MITKNPRTIREIFVQKNDEKSSQKKQPFQLALRTKMPKISEIGKKSQIFNLSKSKRAKNARITRIIFVNRYTLPIKNNPANAENKPKTRHFQPKKQQKSILRKIFVQI